jgi:uncharacterized membrane protein (UPF0127 family)
MLKKFALQLVILIVLICVGLAVSVNPKLLSKLSFLNQNFFLPNNSSQNNSSQNSANTKMQVVKIIGLDGSTKATVNIEVANTTDLRSKGLGGRDSLERDSGMLFVFDSLSQYKFWMKGMRFPLDMIWIKDDTVSDIIPNVPNAASNTPDSALPVYGPNVPVNRILEVNSGYAQSHGIVVGDKLVQVQ